MENDIQRFISRAKSKGTGQWVRGVYFCCMVYGYLVDYILTAECFSVVKGCSDGELLGGHGFNEAAGDFHEIISETRGQGTGFTDKNGDYIMEKDIVLNLADGAFYEVRHSERGFVLFNDRKQRPLFDCLSKDLEIRGNSIDKPELLKSHSD